MGDIFDQTASPSRFALNCQGAKITIHNRRIIVAMLPGDL